MNTSIHERLLDKLRCPCPLRGRLSVSLGPADGPGSLVCGGCGSLYPVRDRRFPDFLNEADRALLAEELKFWEDHFGGEAYADESEESYRAWSSLIDSTADSEIIELGCGSGALLARIPAALRVGLEPAESLLRPSRGFEGVIGTADRLPFRDGAFDIVYFKHSLHHVQDKSTALSEACRITRPGGKLIVIEPNAAHPHRRIISNPKSLLRRSGIFSSVVGPVETFQTSGELTRILAGHGLVLERLQYSESHYERLTIRQALQRIYSRILKPVLSDELLYPNYFAEFRKPG